MHQQQNRVMITIDGDSFSVPQGITVAVALDLTGHPQCRQSVTHQNRLPFCGMGICQECRVTVNGQRRPACQTLCSEGMNIERTSS
ncbi:(2Fe-2S)-binding protein [Pragia fontium]|uniref:(2Fe-2S)-binding protein n=1 Tax=Pragia fontium TaxID=82985 RepID=UPI0008FFB91D|nr:(2Fe-2S)-binding protein [Pragia fontium]